MVKCCALVLLTTEDVEGLILIIYLSILFFGQILIEPDGSQDILRNSSSKTEGCVYIFFRILSQVCGFLEPCAVCILYCYLMTNVFIS